MSEDHEIRNENDVKFEDMAKGDIYGFKPNSGIDSTENPEFLNNQFTFGANKTEVGQYEKSTIDRIRDRQEQTKRMNQEQKEWHDGIRSGRISTVEALANPHTVQRIQIQDGADTIFMSEEDRKLRQRFNDVEYDEAMRQTIIAERIQRQKQQEQILNQQLNPLGYVQAEAQQNPISEFLLGIDIASQGFENISASASTVQDFNSQSTQTNAVDINQQAFHNNVALSVMPNQRDTKMDLNKSQNEKKKQINNNRPLHEEPQHIQQLGAFAIGLTETVKSYETMGINLMNYATGKPQITQSRPPIQDQFISSFYSAIDDSRETGKPFDQSFGNQMDILSEKNKNRPLAQSIGNLSLDAVLFALPIPIALGGKILGSIGKGLAGSDSIVGKTLEASFGTGSKAEKAVNPNNPWSKGTYQNTNMMRDKLPSDIFGLDTVSSFFTTPFRFGSGAGIAKGRTVGSQSKSNKPIEEDYYYDNKAELPKDNQGRKISPNKLFEDDVVKQQYNAFIGESKSLGQAFQGINVNLGIGIGKTTGKGSKGSGSGGKTTPSNKPTTPKPDEPKVDRTNNGQILVMENKPIVKTKTQQKQILEQAKKNKKKKSQNSGSDYYLSTEIIRATPNQQSALSLSLPSLKLDFGSSLKQEFGLGIVKQQSKQQVKQGTKQNSKLKQRQPIATLQRPIMARGNPRPFALSPMLAMPLPFANTPAQQRPMPFIPWGLEQARKGKRGKKKKSKYGKQGWYVPRIDPLGLTKQFKSGEGTDMTFKYWGTGNLQTKVGYF